MTMEKIASSINNFAERSGFVPELIKRCLYSTRRWFVATTQRCCRLRNSSCDVTELGTACVKLECRGKIYQSLLMSPPIMVEII